MNLYQPHELPRWAGELTKVRPLSNAERMANYSYKRDWSRVRSEVDSYVIEKPDGNDCPL